MAEIDREAPLFDRTLNIQVQGGAFEAKNVSLVFRLLRGILPNKNNDKMIHLEVKITSFTSLHF